MGNCFLLSKKAAARLPHPKMNIKTYEERVRA